jgi:hypothetical protein
MDRGLRRWLKQRERHCSESSRYAPRHLCSSYAHSLLPVPSFSAWGRRWQCHKTRTQGWTRDVVSLHALEFGRELGQNRGPRRDVRSGCLAERKTRAGGRGYRAGLILSHIVLLPRNGAIRDLKISSVGPLGRSSSPKSQNMRRLGTEALTFLR